MLMWLKALGIFWQADCGRCECQLTASWHVDLQERNRLPDVADEELNKPPPQPLQFDIDQPELLDDDMVEILLLPEASPQLSFTSLNDCACLRVRCFPAARGMPHLFFMLPDFYAIVCEPLESIID